MWMVSEEEVFSAIRYLDPDLPDSSRLDEYQTRLRSKRRLKRSLLIALFAIIFGTAVAGVWRVGTRGTQKPAAFPL